mgnify:CR=1 FL=1
MKGYLDAKELESYKKEDLQELAKQLGVDAEGTKKEIAARCAAVEVDIPDDNELTEEDKKAAAEAAAEAAAKAEEEKAAAEAAAKALNIDAAGGLVGSTGVIGMQIPIDKIKAGITELAKGKKADKSWISFPPVLPKIL